MKTFLFLLSLTGFCAAGYFLVTDLMNGYGANHLIYVLLLVILLCNSILGMLITYPGELFKKRRSLKLVPVKK